MYSSHTVGQHFICVVTKLERPCLSCMLISTQSVLGASESVFKCCNGNQDHSKLLECSEYKEPF